MSPMNDSSITSRSRINSGTVGKYYYREAEVEEGPSTSFTSLGKKNEGAMLLPNESTRLFSVDADLKLAKRVRAQGSWSAVRAFVTMFSMAIVAMVCIYVSYSDDAYGSAEKVLSTEAKEAKELYMREKFLIFGKQSEGEESTNVQGLGFTGSLMGKNYR
jgi:hypothetical protein